MWPWGGANWDSWKIFLLIAYLYTWYTPVRKVFAEREVLWQSLGGNESTSTRLCHNWAVAIMRGNQYTHGFAMAPPHVQAPSTRYERNRNIALLSDLGKSYKQIARDLSVASSTVRGVVKRYWARGHVHEAGRSGRPSKVTSHILQQVEDRVQKNPWAFLDEIAEGLKDWNIGRTTINKVTKQLGFQLRILRKKQFLVPFAKIRRKFWCHARWHWAIARWRKCVWLDEAKMMYLAYQPGRKVRIRPGEELEEKNLAPSFKSGSVGVGFWAAIAYGWQTPLIQTRKCTLSERTRVRHKAFAHTTLWPHQFLMILCW